MVDVLAKENRSALMAKIRSRGNKSTELRLMTILRGHHLSGWRRNVSLPGRPDFVFRKQRLAVFVDGCFWHGCPIHGHVPKSRLEYWIPKLARNRRRDRQVRATLRDSGWRVYRIWEHELGDPERIAARLSRLLGETNGVHHRPRAKLQEANA